MTTVPKLTAVHLDKHYPECCTIDLEFLISQTLGQPIKLPEAIETLCAKHWANSDEVEPNLLALFELITGTPYEQVARDNTYNCENDLDRFMVFTIYAPVGYADWCWTRDVFVAVEIGVGGDPRYCAYSPAQIYRLDDTTVADCGFLDVTLGWWLEPISDRYERAELDRLNDECSSCYSNSPYFHLTEATYAAPIWSESRGCYLVRPTDCAFVCRAMPIEPAYG